MAGRALHDRLRRVLVRRRNAACRGSGLARAAILSALWLGSRPVVARIVRQRLARQRLRVARQRDAGRAHASATAARLGAGAAARSESRRRRTPPAALAPRTLVGALDRGFARGPIRDRVECATIRRKVGFDPILLSAMQ